MVIYENFFFHIVKIQSEYSVQNIFKNVLIDNSYKALNQKLKTSQDLLNFRYYCRVFVLWYFPKTHSGFQYFYSNLVKLDELGKVQKDSVETL